jgi:hypothetical protein
MIYRLLRFKKIMNQGWIKVFRSIRSHWIWSNSEYLKWWIDIIIEVNHAPDKTLIKGVLLTCNRGEKLYSYETWAIRWGVTKSMARRFLLLLEKDGMILIKSETVTTRVTICNYDTYQDNGNGTETQVKRKRNASETQVKTIEELKNYKELKNKNPKVFRQEILDCYDSCINYFPEDLVPKGQKEIDNWLDAIEKLNRLDKWKFEDIIAIVAKTREDPFWQKNFLSIAKLRTKDKEGLQYINVFYNKFRIDLKQKHHGYTRQQITELTKHFPNV